MLFDYSSSSSNFCAFLHWSTEQSSQALWGSRPGHLRWCQGFLCCWLLHFHRDLPPNWCWFVIWWWEFKATKATKTINHHGKRFQKAQQIQQVGLSDCILTVYWLYIDCILTVYWLYLTVVHATTTFSSQHKSRHGFLDLIFVHLFYFWGHLFSRLGPNWDFSLRVVVVCESCAKVHSKSPPPRPAQETVVAESHAQCTTSDSVGKSCISLSWTWTATWTCFSYVAVCLHQSSVFIYSCCYCMSIFHLQYLYIYPSICPSVHPSVHPCACDCLCPCHYTSLTHHKIPGL